MSFKRDQLVANEVLARHGLRLGLQVGWAVSRPTCTQATEPAGPCKRLPGTRQAGMASATEWNVR